MNIDMHRVSGNDSPLGDREGADQEWTPATVKKISQEEVKNPHDQPNPDIEESDDDASKD